MALAARSSAEPRTACPVCGGSIHPIAGKCKHCKTDLVKLRRQQQAAAGTPPPARTPFGVPTPVRAPTAPPGVIAAPMNGSHSSPVPMAAPVVISAPVPAIDPYVAPEVQRSAWSRSWPIVVAVIAAGAIVVSVILLLTGGNKRDPKVDRVIPPPAPDRMNTDPLPSDPWNGATPGGGSGNTFPSAPDPSQPTPPAPPPAPSGGGPTASSAPAPEQFNIAMFGAICARLSSCGADASAKTACDELTQAASQFADSDLKDKIARGECTYDRDKASSCMSMLQHIPCSQGQGADIGQISNIINGVSDCGAAIACH
jgi:hypothetical protein